MVVWAGTPVVKWTLGDGDRAEMTIGRVWSSFQKQAPLSENEAGRKRMAEACGAAVELTWAPFPFSLAGDKPLTPIRTG